MMKLLYILTQGKTLFSSKTTEVSYLEAYCKDTLARLHFMGENAAVIVMVRF